MKYIKSIYESDWFASDNFTDDIKSNISDIFCDLTDFGGFGVEISNPSLKNFYRLTISIIKIDDDKATSYKLSDIKDCFIRLQDYLETLGFFIDEFDCSGPTFSNFKKIEIPSDVMSWNPDQELILMVIYIDKNK